MNAAHAEERIELSIGGMTCASCVSHVTRALRRVEGVDEVSVNLATERASVAVEPGMQVANLIAAVERAGYHAQVAPDEETATRERVAALHAQARGLLWGSVAAAIVVALAMLPLHFPGNEILQAILATGVWLTLGAHFHRGAWMALRDRSATMDTLVSLGSTAALALSFVNLARGVPTYFETAAAIIALISIGKYIEARAKVGSSQALRELIALRPPTAVRVAPDGTRETVAADLLRVGDLVAVAAGERVPIDGEIVEGGSAIDRSMLTGESMPVEVGAGDRVDQGTLNGDGALMVRATAVGAGTSLAHITAVVARAQGSLPPVQRTADRIASVFVPTILAIALLTLVGWLLTHHAPADALIASVAVLVVACPCALGRAAPPAVVAGVGVAARNGILVKDADALERLASVDTVLFDKTGTLTRGRPQVVAIDTFVGDEARLLSLAASLEIASTHPLAGAVVREARARSLAITPSRDVTAVRGRGLAATLEGGTLLVGSAAFLRERGVELSEPPDAEAIESALYVAENGTALGRIRIADPIRDDARSTVERLKARGIVVALASGDALGVTERIAAACGIERVYAELLPEGKGELVRKLRDGGAHVAFLGDGINDAPALALANVGMAMGAGAAVALETAGTAALRDDPWAIVDAIEIGRATMRTIVMNFFWALAYNVALVPLAAFGIVAPIYAAGAMGASSLFVVGNAMWLSRRYSSSANSPRAQAATKAE
uniref:Copper-transporting P-type ATPase CopA (Protein CopA) n=1 Tax=mine drainage metagenome TaxID=410659 RepID=E6Q643_9ZZZZ